eukprot:3622210-Pyramimonas_sp.AAC.1
MCIRDSPLAVRRASALITGAAAVCFHLAGAAPRDSAEQRSHCLVTRPLVFLSHAGMISWGNQVVWNVYSAACIAI